MKYVTQDRLDALHAAAARRAAAPAQPGCPAVAWDEVVCGATPPAQAREALRHAVDCPHCGPLLRAAAEAAVESTTPDLPTRRWRHGRWYAGGLALAAAIVLTLWVPGGGRAWLANRLLDRAYAEHRTLPLRFAGADYGPMAMILRGGPAAPPSSLLEAEGLIADALARRPNDVGLLQEQGRADLAAGNVAGALAVLGRAQVLDPTSTSVETDLGSAYYLSAEAGHTADYGTALDALGHVLVTAPRDPIARFNRALVEEALYDYTGAIEDWQNYLKQDVRSQWAAEARDHLAADAKLVHDHDAAVAAPLLTPAAFAQLSTVDAATDVRVEAYLDAATEQWLPAAYPVTGTGDAGARTGLRRLASWLVTAHGDHWLEAVLAQAGPNAAFAHGLADLAAAVNDNASGKPDYALAAARRADAELTSVGAAAAGARADYEAVYALQRAEHGPQCLAEVSADLPPAALRTFGWLAAASDLERENCGIMSGLNREADLRTANRLSRAHAYPVLAMRGQEYLGAEAQSPNAEAAWRLQEQELAQYWRSPIGPVPGYQPSLQLAWYLSRAGKFCGAERLGLAAATTVARARERSYEAMTRQLAADYAAQCGLPGEARAQSSEAAALFRALPPTPATANLLAYGELDLAEVETSAGNKRQAAQDLAVYRRDQPPVVNVEARAEPYFALEGELAFAQKRWREAEVDDRAAIAITESDIGRLGADQDRLAWMQRNRDAYRDWVVLQEREHHDAVAAIEFWEWARAAPIRASQPLPATFLAAAEHLDASGAPLIPEPTLVRSRLAGLRAAQEVSYLILPNDLEIWLFDNRGVHHAEVAVASQDLERAARRFTQNCADPAASSALLEAESQQLYGWLLQPLASWLDPARSLIVEPDGALAAIPFAALRDSAGRYLIQTVQQSPGLAYARLARPAGHLSSARLLAVADPASNASADDPATAPLPGVAAEAVALADEFPSSVALTGAGASREAILAALAQAEIFHFAGHADDDRLSVAGGASLTAADLVHAGTRCRLAVLAACSTGFGDTLADPTGLPRALLRSGVDYVVASKWPVDSAATAELCRWFYAALRAGQPVPRALQAAQTRLRQQPATAAPFYWAAFAVFSARL